jgi:hypothetical protein
MSDPTHVPSTGLPEKPAPKKPITRTASTAMSEERELFYISIGQGITVWTGTETLLVQIAARLLCTSELKAGLVLYSITNFFSWLTIIDDLFTMEPKFASLKPEWGPIAEKLKALNDTRVRLAHHTAWGCQQIHGKSFLRPGFFDVRPKSRKYPPLTASEIVAFSQRVRSVYKQMDAFLEKMNAVTSSAGPLHGTLFEQAGDPNTPKDSQ